MHWVGVRGSRGRTARVWKAARGAPHFGAWQRHRPAEWVETVARDDEELVVVWPLPDAGDVEALREDGVTLERFIELLANTAVAKLPLRPPGYDTEDGFDDLAPSLN